MRAMASLMDVNVPSDDTRCLVNLNRQGSMRGLVHVHLYVRVDELGVG